MTTATQTSRKKQPDQQAAHPLILKNPAVCSRVFFTRFSDRADRRDRPRIQARFKKFWTVGEPRAFWCVALRTRGLTATSIAGGLRTPEFIFTRGQSDPRRPTMRPPAAEKERRMNSVSADRQLVRAAMSAPYLQRDEEHDLALKWRDDKDQDALHKITMAHMRLVISMAAKFRNFGLPMNDLIQEGHVGLLEAAARFDPEREVRFSTYASWWIRASIQDFILRNWSIVRGGTSSAQKALFFNLRRLRARLSQGQDNLSESALHSQIADALGVHSKDVAIMDARLSSSDTSLNAPVNGNEDGSSSDRVEFLESDDPLPDEQVSTMIDEERRNVWLGDALKALNPRELRIINERRLSEDSATLESLGQSLGISKERVRQIENRALEKLKTVLVRETPEIATL
jgi:RNA polymerase sigma-32 factor